MSDAFAVLKLPRRPFLRVQDIKEAHHRLAAAPDAGARLAALNDARAVLEDPAQRLRLLAGDLAGLPAPTADWDFLMRCGAVFKNAERWLRAWASATTALQRAVLKSELRGLRADLDALCGELDERDRALQRELESLDARWPGVSPVELATLAGEFVFLQRQRDLAGKARVDLEIAAG